MANETFDGVARKVLLRCEPAGILLAQDWVRNAFRDIVERRQWSWLLKRGQLITYDQYTTGTATILAGTRTVTLAGGGIVSADHIGRQFRGTSSVTQPIYTIYDADTIGNTYTLDGDWWPTDFTAGGFSVYQAYVPMPTDFQSFVSVIDPRSGLYVPFDYSITQIDRRDPQRASSATSDVKLAFLDYYLDSSGGRTARYELWPHQRSAYVYPMTYVHRPADPFDTGSFIPDRIPADILLERAMMYCAQWPGPDKNNANPYYNERTAQFHEAQYKERLLILERQDNAHMQQDLFYQRDDQGRPLSASYMQSHDW